MHFFTADTHLGHWNINKYVGRGFSTLEDMDNTIISMWNSRVSPGDIVYHLGDFCFGDPVPYLDRLNGNIILIPGDHDRRIVHTRHPKLEVVDRIYSYVGNTFTIILCHYALRVWHKSHYNSWHLFAHSHGRLLPIGKSWDIGIDNWRNFSQNMRERITPAQHDLVPPLSFSEIEFIMQLREDNPNLVTKRS